MFIFSGIYVALNIILVQSAGAIGLIAANSLSILHIAFPPSMTVWSLGCIFLLLKSKMDKKFTYYVLVFLFEQYYTTFHLGMMHVNFNWSPRWWFLRVREYPPRSKEFKLLFWFRKSICCSNCNLVHCMTAPRI